MLIIPGVPIFVVSYQVADNIPQCNGQILESLLIACDTAESLLTAVMVLAVVILLIGITLTIIGPLAPQNPSSDGRICNRRSFFLLVVGISFRKKSSRG